MMQLLLIDPTISVGNILSMVSMVVGVLPISIAFIVKIANLRKDVESLQINQKILSDEIVKIQDSNNKDHDKLNVSITKSIEKLEEKVDKLSKELFIFMIDQAKK